LNGEYGRYSDGCMHNISVTGAACKCEGSMDPYSRAPRSPKSKQQTTKVFFDTGLTTGPQIDDCKSPSVEQVGMNIISPLFNLPLDSVCCYIHWNEM